MNRDAEQLWQRLRDRGFTVSRTAGNHIRVDHPQLPYPVYGPSTPSDHRSLANFRAKLRRAMRKKSFDKNRQKQNLTVKP